MQTTSDDKTFNRPTLSFLLSLMYSKLLDLLSSSHHSEDFKQTRTNLIVVRLKLMCLLFAITVPTSFIFDLLSLGETLALQIFPLRLALSFALIILFISCNTHLRTHFAYLLLCVAFLLPTLFYLAVAFKLKTLGVALPQSLSITPFLIITMLGLFPLTIRSGVILFCSISLSIGVFSYLFLQHPTQVLIHQLWQLGLFGGVAIWLQLGQLSMLMKLYRESTIDPLTGLINRRVLMRQLDHVCTQSLLTREACSLMILDLDKFKRVNDQFGHQFGDTVLKALSSILLNKSNKKDIAARFGGEEFVFLMPNTSLIEAIDRAKYIADSVRNLEIRTNNMQVINITTSIGISEFNSTSTPEDLIKNADELLYKAKAEGRDCIRY